MQTFLPSFHFFHSVFPSLLHRSVPLFHVDSKEENGSEVLWTIIILQGLNGPSFHVFSFPFLFHLFTRFFPILYILAPFLLTQKLSVLSIETRVTQVSGKVSGNLSITEPGTGSQGCTICIGMAVGRQSRSSPTLLFFVLFKSVLSCLSFTRVTLFASSISFFLVWIILTSIHGQDRHAHSRRRRMTRGIPSLRVKERKKIM